MSMAANPTTTTKAEFVNEVPSSLKQLARLVVRGFYLEEDVLIVDMLVRHPCLREDDLGSLLKFDKKMLRARVAILRNDKFIQTKQRIETDEEGKVVKMNCHFINFRIFVNILKYKLDHMRKKMETSERDQTSRSSFKCLRCQKNFTDLEANQLLEPSSGEMRCTFCSGVVDEDEASGGPQLQDSRKLLAQFNSEMKFLYELLHVAEVVNLSPELLEPEPVDLDVVMGRKSTATSGSKGPEGGESGKWSGDATRSLGGFREESQRFEIAIGDDAVVDSGQKKKEVPAWIQQSALGNEQLDVEAMDDGDDDAAAVAATAAATAEAKNDVEDEISLLLLRHERKAGDGGQRALVPTLADDDSGSDKSDLSDVEDVEAALANKEDDLSSDEVDDGPPTVRVGKEELAITDVTEDIIERMTLQEKEKYTQVFQDFYAHVYE